MPSAQAARMAGAMMRISSSPKSPALARVRVQPRHRDARMWFAPFGRGTVRDAQRLEHGVEGHAVDGGAQRQVDRDQHGAQLVVGQHHAHRRRRAARIGERLQHLGMPRVADAGRGERFLVDRRSDDGCHRAAASERRRDFDAGRGGGPRMRVDASRRKSIEITRQAGRHEHRDAPRRHFEGLLGAVYRCDGQHACGPSGGAPQHRQVTDHEATSCAFGIAKQLRDDLGTDAADIAHRDGNRRVGAARCRLNRGWRYR